MSLAPPSPSPLVPGYRLDRYELLCPIADGGMAQVWVARLRGKHGFEKLVAIKSILPKFAADSQFQKMFLDEARIASGIEHTNVAQIFDLGDEHGVLYIAMEWVDGDALTKLHRALDKKGETIPMGVLLRIVADVCGGLHAAHELRTKSGTPLGVVHRDVSPQNILLTTRGVAKLIDFGIAKARDRTSGDTSTGTLKGKVHYMAPEQALGQGIDRRADIWAIGSILYHYLAGKPPFDGPNQIATLHQLMLGKPPAPLPEKVPPAVAAIVRRALEHEPEKRFATAAEVQAAIEGAMTSSNLATSTADVAACIEKHLSDRAAKRREAIDIALSAAADRERVQELDRDDKLPPPPSVPTAAGLGLGGTIHGLPTGGRRNAVIAAVGVVGVILGIGVTFAFRSGERARAPSSVAAAAATVPAASAPASSSPPAASIAPPPTDQPSAQTATLPPSAGTPTTTPARPAPMARPQSNPARPPSRGKIPQVIDNGF